MSFCLGVPHPRGVYQGHWYRYGSTMQESGVWAAHLDSRVYRVYRYLVAVLLTHCVPLVTFPALLNHCLTTFHQYRYRYLGGLVGWLVVLTRSIYRYVVSTGYLQGIG